MPFAYLMEYIGDFHGWVVGWDYVFSINID